MSHQRGPVDPAEGQQNDQTVDSSDRRTLVDQLDQPFHEDRLVRDTAETLWRLDR